MKRIGSTLFTPLVAAALIGSQPVSAQAPICNQSVTTGCLYVPATEYTIGTEPPAVIRKTAYKDVAGMLRTVEMAIRVPKAATGPLPVVIWSHGGADGRWQPDDVLVEWSRTTAKAGYLTVTIAHQPRELTSRYALCAEPPLSMENATCDLFKHLHWDRPHDISAVINELERLNAAGEFRGQIDLLRIAVGGHSAGSSGALSVAGALRDFTGTVLDLSDSRPVAFLAFSPQGPGGEGFFDTDFKKPAHSWMPIDRPVLLGTGDGDNVCHRSAEPGNCVGDSPYIRRIGFERMPDGNKYQIYIHDADTFHTLFALNTADCTAKNVDQGKCDEIARWLRSTALAFLDAQLRQNLLATQWLRSNNIETASGGAAEWLAK